MFIALCCTGCVAKHATKEHLHARPSLEKIYQNATKEFDNAIFYKPHSQDPDRLETRMAPLLVFELAEGNDTPANQIGTVVPIGHDEVTIDWSAPAVYTSTGQALLGDGLYDQVTYVWCGAHRSQVALFGVRITLATDGFPIIWEALGDPSAGDLVFVSETLEAEATDLFLTPLKGRRHVIERAVEDAPNTVVVDILPDGPMPMGPYIYLGADLPPGLSDAQPTKLNTLDSPHTQHSIYAVVCRCSPSRVERFARDSMYVLLPIGDLLAVSEDIAATLRRMGLGEDESKTLDQGDRSDFPRHHHPQGLSRRLRLPPPVALR